MAAITNAKPIAGLYVRDMGRAIEIQNEVQLIFTVVLHAFEIAREVTAQAHKIPKDKDVVVNPKKVPFKVTAEFLIRLVEPSAPLSYTMGKALNPQNLTAVKLFFQKASLAFPYFENPHLEGGDRAHYRALILEMASPLQMAYRQQGNWFKKIELPKPWQNISCFDYVIIKVGLDYREFRQFLYSATKGQQKITFFDYINFLKAKEMQQAALPLQAGDILVYYHDDKEQVSHAALVADNPHKVHAKFGDGVPFAYLHNVEETPISYGSRYQIFRKGGKEAQPPPPPSKEG